MHFIYSYDNKERDKMHINSMNFATPFSGIARIDYKKTETEINKCPPHTREAIWGNINTLKDYIEFFNFVKLGIYSHKAAT